MRNRRLLVLAITGLAQAGAAQAANSCSPAQARAATVSLDTVGTWEDLHLSFRQFGACDHGALAAGYSQAVVLLFTGDWPTVTRLPGLFHQDPGFRRFVLHHLDANMSAAEYARLRYLSAKKCPSKAEAVCRDLRRGLSQLQGQIHSASVPEDLEPPRP